MTSLNKVQTSFLNIVFNDVKKTCDWLLSEHVDLANTGKKIAVLATFIIGSAAIFTGLVFSGGLPLVAIPIIAVGSSLITSLVLGSYLRTSYCVNKQESQGLESGGPQAEQPETIEEQLNRLIYQDMSQEQKGNIEEQLNNIPENEREQFVQDAEKVIVQIKQADFSPNKQELDNNQNIVRFVQELGKIPNDERDRFATQVEIMIRFPDRKNDKSKSEIISEISALNTKEDRDEYFWDQLVSIQNNYCQNKMDTFLNNLNQSYLSAESKREFKQDLLNLIRGDKSSPQIIMDLMEVLVEIPAGERGEFISQINRLIKDGKSISFIYSIIQKLKEISSDKRDDFVNQALRIINCSKGDNLTQTLTIMGLLVEIPEIKQKELVNYTIQAVGDKKVYGVNIVEIMNEFKKTHPSERSNFAAGI